MLIFLALACALALRSASAALSLGAKCPGTKGPPFIYTALGNDCPGGCLMEVCTNGCDAPNRGIPTSAGACTAPTARTAGTTYTMKVYSSTSCSGTPVKTYSGLVATTWAGPASGNGAYWQYSWAKGDAITPNSFCNILDSTYGSINLYLDPMGVVTTQHFVTSLGCNPSEVYNSGGGTGTSIYSDKLNVRSGTSTCGLSFTVGIKSDGTFAGVADVGFGYTLTQDCAAPSCSGTCGSVTGTSHDGTTTATSVNQCVVTCAAGTYVTPSRDTESSPSYSTSYWISPSYINSGSTLQGFPCLACAAGKYSAAGAGSCTNCAANTYSAAGSASCTACAIGSTSGTGSATCTVCPAGSAVVNGVCSACAANTYSAAGSTSCTPCAPGSTAYSGSATCTVCPAGSAVVNGVCTSCNSNYHSPSAGATACTPCPAGSTSDSYGSITSCNVCPAGAAVVNGVCSYCGKNTYSAAGATNCTPCAPGSTSYSGSTSCTVCPAGSAVTGGSCSECTVYSYPATYTSAAGSVACSPCTGGTVSSDRTTCTNCTAGSYYSGYNSCGTCSPGKYSTAGATSCSSCQAGSIATSDRTGCTQCAAGKYSSDSYSCSTCSGNTISAAGAASCSACPPGSVASNNKCTLCPRGTYQGGSTCWSCPDGTVSAGNVTKCSPCPFPLGPNDEGECALCPPGSFYRTDVSFTDRGFCQKCYAGRYSPANYTSGYTGTSTDGYCLRCPAGYLGTSPASGNCTPCEAGKYGAVGASFYSDNYCFTCPVNFYSAAGSAACTPCPAGSFSAQAGATSASSCVYCAPGTFLTSSGCAPLASLNKLVVSAIGAPSSSLLSGAAGCSTRCASTGYTVAFASGATVATLIPGASNVGACPCYPMTGRLPTSFPTTDLVSDLDCGVASGGSSEPCSLSVNGVNTPTLKSGSSSTLATYGALGCSSIPGAASSPPSTDPCTGSLSLSYASDTVGSAATACQRACALGSYTLTLSHNPISRVAYLTPLVSNAGPQCTCDAFSTSFSSTSSPAKATFTGTIPGTSFGFSAQLEPSSSALVLTFQAGGSATFTVSSCSGSLAAFCPASAAGAPAITAPIASATRSFCTSTTGAALPGSVCSPAACSTGSYADASTGVCKVCEAGYTSKAPAFSIFSCFPSGGCSSLKDAVTCASNTIPGGCTWSGLLGSACAAPPAAPSIGMSLRFAVASGNVTAYATKPGTAAALADAISKALSVPASSVSILSITASSGARELGDNEDEHAVRSLQGSSTAVVASSVTSEAAAASSIIGGLVKAAGGSTASLPALGAAITAFMPTAIASGALSVADATPGSMTFTLGPVYVGAQAVEGGASGGGTAATQNNGGAIAGGDVGAIAGGVVGGCVAVGLIAAAFWYFRCRKPSAKPSAPAASGKLETREPIEAAKV